MFLRFILVVFTVVVLDVVFIADVHIYLIRADNLGFYHLPYRDFLWEYPPLAVLPLLFVPMSHHSNQVFFPLFATLTVSLEYASLCLIRRAVPEHKGTITALWTIAVLPLCLIAWFRMDILPMFFATLGVLALRRGSSSPASVIAGFSAKLWPIVLVGPMIIKRQWKSVAIAVCGSMFVLVVWRWFSVEGFNQFLAFRRGQGFQIESIPGNLLTLDGRRTFLSQGAVVVDDSGWEWAQVALNVLLVGFPAALLARAWRRPDRIDFIAMTAALTSGLLLTTRLLSPQFLVWLAPAVVLLWPKSRMVGVLFTAISWLTIFVMQTYIHYTANGLLQGGAVFLRNLLLVYLTVVLVRLTFPSDKSSPTSADQGVTEITPKAVSIN